MTPEAGRIARTMIMASGPQPPADDLPDPAASVEETPRAPADISLPRDVKRITEVAGPSGEMPAPSSEPFTQQEPASALTVKSPTRPSAPLTVADRPIPQVQAGAETPGVTTTPPKGAVQPVLRVVRGEFPNQPFPLLDGRNFIGRASHDRTVDIDLTPQEAVERVWASRQHALVTLDRGVAVIEDLNSLNGTFINRVRLHPGQRQVLQPGDVVQIGTVQLRYEV